MIFCGSGKRHSKNEILFLYDEPNWITPSSERLTLELTSKGSNHSEVQVQFLIH